MANANGKLNLAVIGCGRIAQTHLQAIGSLPQTNLVSVADINQEVVESVAQQFNCKPYRDYQEMIAREAIDIVCVCTPPVQHPQVSIDALSKGIHVLCEKPFAIDSASARAMVEKAKEKGLHISMASKFRFVKDIIKAKGIIESGLLGEIVLFEITFCSRLNMQDRWSSNKAVSGGGVLIDNGSHAVDLARYLVGPIARVQAQHGKRIQKIEVEDTSMLFFESKNGVWGRVDLSWSIHKESDFYIHVFGTDGMLSVGWKASRYRRSEKENWTVFGEGYNKLQAFIDQHKNFIECVQGKGKLVIDAIDSLESVKVIETAYESSQTFKWLEVSHE